jgi:hypothetical protein
VAFVAHLHADKLLSMSRTRSAFGASVVLDSVLQVTRALIRCFKNSCSIRSLNDGHRFMKTV